MAGQGEPVVKILRETISQKPNEYILMVEGSVPTAEDGLYCTIGKLDGEEVVMKDMTAELARDALAVLDLLGKVRASCGYIHHIPVRMRG